MNIPQTIEKQREFYNSNIPKNIDYRIKTLKKLKEGIIRNENKIEEALKKDLNKSSFESYMCEIGMSLNAITDTLKHIEKWTKTKKVKTPLSNFPAKSFIIPESYGVTLIISPWNYPFLLSIEPLVSAIAAGNTVIIKPSEYSPNTSKIIAELIDETFERGHVDVIEGGIEISEELLNQKFDYIFYTGGTAVGKIVMEKASNNLTPVTLELRRKKSLYCRKISKHRISS